MLGNELISNCCPILRLPYLEAHELSVDNQQREPRSETLGVVVLDCIQDRLLHLAHIESLVKTIVSADRGETSVGHIGCLSSSILEGVPKPALDKPTIRSTPK